MSTSPLPQPETIQLWSDCLVNRLAALAVMVLLLVEILDLIRLYPHLLRCMPLWKGNVELEHSVSTARTRNTVAFVMALVCCILADRWELISPSFKMQVPVQWRLALTSALLLGAVLLRRLAYLASPYRSLTSEHALTLRHALFNYFILLVSLMLVSAILMLAFRAPDAVVRKVLLIESAFFAFVHLLRTGQILASRCGTFATFLYLCALEILPIGILVFVCTL